MTTITINQTETIVASTDDIWIIANGIMVETSGLGIDASESPAGSQFTIIGTLRSNSGPAMTLGSDILDDIDTTIWVDDVGTFASGGAGLIAVSGGVTFQVKGNSTQAGLVETVGASLDLRGSGNSVKNDGTMRSTAGSVVISAGDGDTIDNNGTMEAYYDAIISSGDDVVITSNSALVATQGRAVVSSGLDCEIINNGQITARFDAITSAGDNAVITNNDSINCAKGAGIKSSGAGATIYSGTQTEGMTFGILSTGAGAHITNDGIVSSAGIGIQSSGDGATILTTSQLKGAIALVLSGDDSTAINTNVIRGTSKHDAAVQITTDIHATFVNEGAVHAKSGLAVSSGKGGDTVANTGSLYGDVKLGAGNDVFTATEGQVTGKVYGGKGNDVYETGIKLHIAEKAGEGYDLVRSQFSWKLGANLENLELTGTSDAFARGNTLDNIITGNAGANTLTGGAGRDTFVFATGGDDTINDLQDHKDHIDFSNLPGVESFADIAGHMTKVGNDVLIDLTDLEADLYLTIKHITLARLTEADFLF